MKRVISIVFAAILLVGMLAAAVPAVFAADAAQTVVSVKAGDEVTYNLMLGDVPEKVIACDFSVYYDADVFELVKVADYSGSYDEDDWNALLNPDLEGEVRGNWYTGSVDFSKTRTFVSLVLKATADASAHISYYVRDMAGESYFLPKDNPSHQEIGEYTFTCDVLVNGSPVIEEAAPELEVEKPQDIGGFVNSVTGDSKDADVVLSEDNASSGGNSGSSGSGNSGNSGSSGSNGGNSGSGSDDGSAGSAEGKSVIVETDAEGNVTATTIVETSQPVSKGSSSLIWIIIAVVAVAAVCGAGYFVMSGKKRSGGEKPSEVNDFKKQ